MDWWLQAQRWGFKFDPTEVQLMVYLYAKVRRWEGICDLIGISDQVYTKPPGEYYSRTAFPGGEKYYCFTELKKMNQNQNRVVRTVGSYGTWHESNCKKIFEGNNYSNKRIIGFKKLLNFKEKGEGKEMMTTKWLMHEFSLPEKDTDLVLCVIQETKEAQKKKEKENEEEMGSNYETYLELYRGCRIEMVSFPDLFSTTRPCPAPAPAPAPAHDDHFALQVLDSEEHETRPSKKMRSDPVSVASSSVDLPLDYWNKFAKRLLEGAPDLREDDSALLDLSGFPDDVSGLPNDVLSFT